MDQIFQLSEKIGANDLYRTCIKAKLVYFSTTQRDLGIINKTMAADILALRAELT